MAARSYFVYPTPMGRVTLVMSGDALIAAHFGIKEFPFEKKASAASNAAASQLQEYLAGKRTAFDCALAPAGTSFQQLVWHALQDIPYGQTITAADLAQTIKRPQSYRAVGNAVHQNPLPLFIPCHRVIEASGKPGHYPHGDQIKEFLLNLEKGRTASSS